MKQCVVMELAFYVRLSWPFTKEKRRIHFKKRDDVRKLKTEGGTHFLTPRFNCGYLSDPGSTNIDRLGIWHSKHNKCIATAWNYRIQVLILHLFCWIENVSACLFAHRRRWKRHCVTLQDISDLCTQLQLPWLRRKFFLLRAVSD